MWISLEDGEDLAQEYPVFWPLHVLEQLNISMCNWKMLMQPFWQRCLRETKIARTAQFAENNFMPLLLPGNMDFQSKSYKDERE